LTGLPISASLIEKDSQMKLNQHNGFVRFILRAIDVLVGYYVPRRVRWDQEPYRKATGSEKRFGGLFMIIIPAIFLAVVVGHKYFDKAVNSMMYGRHSITWLYVGFFVLAGGIGLILPIVGPKISLRASIPVAVLLWAILAWYAWKDLM
jgi:hypothetical protein